MNAQRAAQRGFTLVELVVVIIILGVLAAVALPKFVDLSGDAHAAAAKSVGGAIASASSINFAAKTAGNANAVALNAANVCTSALLTPFVNGVTLVGVAPTKDEEFRIGNSPTAGVSRDCRAAANNSVVECGITPNGTGAVAQAFKVFCAR